jgi:hypothetical protein
MANETRLTLIGDGIENPWNARTMIDAAGMFGSDCLFRDRSGLLDAWQAAAMTGRRPMLVSRDALVAGYAPILALDNLDGAADVYGFRSPPGPRPAVVAGNERRGIARDIASIATGAVQIPMVSRRLNCLNVAAASAVALYYLSRGGGGAAQLTTQPQKRRPELMLIGGADHVELGSTIRSAGAFGWERIFVEDRGRVWFGCDRVTRSEGRAAARRGRNPIRLIAAPAGGRYAFDEVCVVTRRPTGMPVHRANLARGPRQLLVVPDESCLDLEREPWDRLGRAVRRVHLDLPRPNFVYHLRLIASIALAEAARQIGQRARPAPGRPAPREPVYDATLALLMDEQGETVSLDDLSDY